MNDKQKKTILLTNLGIVLEDLIKKKKITKTKADQIVQTFEDQIDEYDFVFADTAKDKINDILHQELLYTEIDYQSIVIK